MLKDALFYFRCPESGLEQENLLAVLTLLCFANSIGMPASMVVLAAAACAIGSAAASLLRSLYVLQIGVGRSRPGSVLDFPQ